MFPYVPKQPGWNKRLRAALPLVKRAIRLPAIWHDHKTGQPVMRSPIAYDH